MKTKNLSKEDLIRIIKESASLPTKKDRMDYIDKEFFGKDSHNVSGGEFIRIFSEYEYIIDPESALDLELSRRYHMLILEKLSQEVTYPTFEQKSLTFRLFEKKVAEFKEGKISQEERKYLLTLPETQKWSENRPTLSQIKSGFYFKNVLV